MKSVAVVIVLKAAVGQLVVVVTLGSILLETWPTHHRNPLQVDMKTRSVNNKSAEFIIYASLITLCIVCSFKTFMICYWRSHFFVSYKSNWWGVINRTEMSVVYAHICSIIFNRVVKNAIDSFTVDLAKIFHFAYALYTYDLLKTSHKRLLVHLD